VYSSLELLLYDTTVSTHPKPPLMPERVAPVLAFFFAVVARRLVDDTRGVAPPIAALFGRCGAGGRLVNGPGSSARVASPSFPSEARTLVCTRPKAEQKLISCPCKGLIRYVIVNLRAHGV
jgi:hypothetical protein